MSQERYYDLGERIVEVKRKEHLKMSLVRGRYPRKKVHVLLCCTGNNSEL